MILLMDQNERVIGHLDNEAPKACPYYSDSWKRDRDTGASTYEFYCPADHPMSGNVKKNGYIVRPNFHGDLMQFQIARIEERHENGILSKFVYCEFAWAELNGEIVRPYNLEGVTADYALTYALSGTRYQPGKIEYSGNQSLSSDAYDTSLKMCHDIKDVFGGEIQFRVVMKNGKITGRYVDLLDRVGANRGKTIIFGKNLTSATRLHDRTTVATALIGVGKGDAGGDQLTFTTYVWRKADGAPVDKPAGQDWVGDPGALAQWGINGRHVTKVFEYDTTSKQVLLQQTWKELQRVKNGVLQYEADAAFLDRFGFDWERSDIGDDVLIQDLYFEPPLMVNARIITLEQSFTDPKAQSATFGDYEEARSNVGRLADIQSTLRKKETQWDEAAQGKATIIRDANRPTPAPNHIWLDPATAARPFDIMYTYNEDTQDWQRATALTPEEIGADRAGAAEAARQAAVKAAADDATRKANAAQAAAESVAAAEALAAENVAKAYADGKITAEEAARIAQDAANLTAAKADAAAKATSAENAAILAASIDATKKAQDAQTAAEALARQEAAAAQTNAQAHADGLITAEEAARIKQAADNLAAAKLDAQQKASAAEAAAVQVAAAAQEAAAAYADGLLSDEEAARILAVQEALAAAKLDATQKANAAEQAAVNAASLDATQKANAAQQAAENLAIAEADAAELNAKTHADGIVTAEEKARLAQAAANLKAAQDDATAKANAAKAAAIEAAKLDATSKANAAQAAAENVAIAQAAAAKEQAQAYADGQISDEEAARIAQAAANLELAKQDAAAKAAAAEGAAKAHAELAASEKTHSTNYKEFFNVMAFENRTATLAGDIYIYTNIPMTSRMYSLDIKGYNYFNNQTDIDLSLGFYAYSTPSFLSQGFVNRGTKVISQVRLALTPDKKVVIILTPATGAWQYPAFTVTRLAVQYGSAPADVQKGWTGQTFAADALPTDLTTITNMYAITAETTTGAQEKATAALNSAKSDATTKANAAQLAAENLARAEADAAQTAAEAYADGKVTAEETARINQANANLAAAQKDATEKAAAAQAAAINVAQLDASQKASAAQTAAEAAAAASALAAEEAAKAHADGIVTAEEQARIDQAAANLAAAKADAQTKATAAETAAKEYARIEAETQSGNAQQNAELRAQYEGRLAEYQGYLSSINAAIEGLQAAADAVLVWPLKYTPETLAEVEDAITNIFLERGTFKVQLDEAIAEGVFTQTRIDRLDEAAWAIEQRMAEAERSIMRATQDAGGLRIGTLTGITVQVNRAGLTADGTTSGAVRIWAGATYAGRNAAPFRVLDNGQLYTSNIQIVGGSINIATDATIGRNLYLGALGDYAAKRISFNAGAYIQATDYSIDVVGGRLNLHDTFNAGMSTDGGALYLDGNILDVNIPYVSFTNEMQIGGIVNVNGPLRANNSGMSANNLAGAGSSTYITPGSGGQWTTNTKETGFCGLQTESNGSTYTVGMGVAVNFKTIKDYTPSSISISRTSGNLANTALFVGYITPYGFWIQITRANASSNAAWRGTYTA